ncbi:MAG TPA: DUF5522 domain-containing protein [Blastocatellia bacterium]|nr:DUF5522 domain-containing protein [Blastocatellia bacterium]
MKENQAADELTEGRDYYRENGFIVFTRKFHLKRGECCGSQCRHCPYEPRWQKGSKTAAAEENQPGSANEPG